jgi:hypothetical protein
MANLTPALFEAGGVPVSWKPKSEPATPVVIETDLDHLAARIRAGLKAAQTALSNALDKVLDVGDTLIAAKARIPEGEWRDWLATNCSLKTSTALLYMQLARHRDEIEAKRKETPELSVRAARKLIADKSKARRELPSPRKPQEDKPEIPDWVVAYNDASDTDKAAGIPHIIIDLFTHMSAAARAKLTARVLGNAAGHAPKKVGDAIRKLQKLPACLDNVSYSQIN